MGYQKNILKLLLEFPDDEIIIIDGYGGKMYLTTRTELENLTGIDKNE